MFYVFVLIVAISLTLQIGVAWLAVRLIRVTGSSKAWIAIAGAMMVMALRRGTVLAGVLLHPETLDAVDCWTEAIGMVNALLFLAGVVAIGPLFRTVQKARESIERSRDELQREVARQTAALIETNERLTTEVARRAEADAALRQEHGHLTRVLAIYELDRHLVAYDIHDGFVQPATAAQMNLQAALSAYAANPDKALEDVVRALHHLQQSLMQVRLLIRGLRPTALEEQGLVPAIGQLVRDAEAQAEIHVDWSSCVTFDRLAPELETSIFRIVQEGLTNAIRHSKSERVAIEMKQLDRTIRITIEDSGSGFDPSIPKAGHYGLEGIRERTRLFGGAARIESAPGQGTRIEVEMPLIERQPSAGESTGG